MSEHFTPWHIAASSERSARSQQRVLPPSRSRTSVSLALIHSLHREKLVGDDAYRCSLTEHLD